MPVQVEFLNNDTLIVITGSGVVTEEEYLQAHTVVVGTENRIRGLTGAMSDWSAVVEVEVSAAAIRRVAEHQQHVARLLPAGFPVALVASRDSVYGLSRMWEAYAEGTGWETQLFRERQAALRWLRTRMPGTREIPRRDTTAS